MNCNFAVVRQDCLSAYNMQQIINAKRDQQWYWSRLVKQLEPTQ
ncbi:MAG: hypothetical protein RBJ76_12670 [Stenomitos frigidus ULC029]